MTLLEKIDIVLKKYNNGEDNEYSENMKTAINIGEKSGHFIFSENTISNMNDYSIFTLPELIGICILDNNPELFKED